MELIQVDAFTARPFAGNPAAVCLLDGPVPANWMQALAAEMNLSETAFVRPVDDGFDLRWFTPAVEVDLCGHATLASAHAMWEVGRVASDDAIRFHTRSGVLVASRNGARIELDFPARPPAEVDAPPGLVEALRGDSVGFVGFDGDDYLIELAGAGAVSAVAPDFVALATIPARGVIVTAKADRDAEHDFVSRFFGPAVGIDEDPVTGSAHCCLAPFWGERLGRTEMIGYQASRRGGRVSVRLAGDRVVLGGEAVTVFRAQLSVEAVSSANEVGT